MKKLLTLLNIKTPEWLYHYTNGDSLIGILREKEFWASHLRSMNDTEEGKLAFNKMLDIIPNVLKEKNIQLNESLLNENIKNAFSNELKEKEIFIISFTTAADDLNMWRGYGAKPPSYSMKINTMNFINNFKSNPSSLFYSKMYEVSDILNDSESDFDFNNFSPSEGLKQKVFLLPCIYDSDKQDELLKTMLEEILEANEGKFDEKSLATKIAKDFIFYCPLIKNNSFKSEEEWRLIILYKRSYKSVKDKQVLLDELDDALDEQTSSKIRSELDNYELNEERLKCDKELINNRVRGSLIVTYYKFRFSELNFIEQIMVGPCSDKEGTLETTKKLLEVVDLKNIKIESSAVPFRNW